MKHGDEPLRRLVTHDGPDTATVYRVSLTVFTDRQHAESVPSSRRGPSPLAQPIESTKATHGVVCAVHIPRLPGTEAKLTSIMRLIYTSSFITDTVLVDELNRRLYATSTSTFGRKTEVMKFGHMWNSNFASLHFHRWRSDTITIHGQKRTAKSYITKPSWWSRSVYAPPVSCSCAD